MKVIHVTLDSDSVDKAIQELEAYKRRLDEKAEELRKRVAFLIATTARDIFSYAVADDLLRDGAIIGGVSVNVENRDGMTLVIADGKDAIFMEFGAGVYHNGAVGSSPNPWGTGLGYTIGSYGLGNGAKEVWGYSDEAGFHLTHGTPASMPLYRSTMAVRQNIEQIAREVFST